MDIRQFCYFALIAIILTSCGYLIYILAAVQIPYLYRLRYINFVLQHLLGIGMLIKRSLFCFDQDACHHLVWMIGFTGVNFVNFVIIQIYGLTHGKTHQELRYEESTISFIVLSYFHLYYQLNIYLGVFCLFSIVMGIVYLINQRRHQQEMEDVLDDLKTQKYQNTNPNQPNRGEQQNCSICLADFQKSQNVYKLVCGHVFHKQCLKDWFHQKLTCPMCRDDVARGVRERAHQEDNSFIVD